MNVYINVTNFSGEEMSWSRHMVNALNKDWAAVIYDTQIKVWKGSGIETHKKEKWSKVYLFCKNTAVEPRCSWCLDRLLHTHGKPRTLEYTPPPRSRSTLKSLTENRHIRVQVLNKAVMYSEEFIEILVGF